MTKEIVSENAGRRGPLLQTLTTDEDAEIAGDGWPAPGSSLAIDAVLPNGDLIVSCEGQRFRLGNIEFASSP